MLHRLPLIRHLWFRPRLFFCLAFSGLLGGLLAWLWPGHHVGSILIAYNAGVMLYVGLAVHMMFTSSKQHMRSRARVQDDGQIAVLLSVVIASIISLLAIAAQLSIAKDLIGISKYGHIALAGLTVITSWSFTQMMFALHYAHAYYQPEDGAHAGGLAVLVEFQHLKQGAQQGRAHDAHLAGDRILQLDRRRVAGQFMLPAFFHKTEVDGFLVAQRRKRTAHGK